MELENRSICEKCGGKCCKKSGCDYFVDDFDVINKNKLIELLDTGNVSIVSVFKFKRINDKLICNPFLYLRVRNTDRDVVDLYSMKTKCSMLTDTGCSYDFENRPGGGKNLVPRENLKCTPYRDQLEELNKWDKYQGVLRKLVKRYSGKSVEEKLSEDVEEVFYKILIEDFEGVSKMELSDILSSIELVVESFPLEYDKAKSKAEPNIKVFRRNNKY